MSWTSQGPRWRIIALLGIAGLVAGGKAPAQSREAKDKRMFAELLGRERTHAREVAHATQATPAVSGFAGLDAASPPQPSGVGPGRDAFVDSIFESTFGRDPTQQELDHLSRLLAHGLSAHTLLVTLWESPEHRKLQEEGLAPHLTIHEAYRMALAAAKEARQEGFPLP